MDFVGSLISKVGIESITVICASSDAEQATLPNGVQTVGIELYPRGGSIRDRELIELVRASQPTHLLAMFPCIPLITWGLRASCRVLPIFADSFRSKGVKAALKYRLLAFLLNARSIEFVSNHNLAASLDLKRIGVRPDKIVPFDWPANISPLDFEPKSPPPPDRVFRLIYVGTIIESKGVADVIGALRILRDRGANVSLTIIGRGEIDKFVSLAASQGIQDFVFFLGSRSHSEVIADMRSHDAVVVPSRWSYPRGPADDAI